MTAEDRATKESGRAQPRVAEAAIWQRVEFGSYAADLKLWSELAGPPGPALELGAGAGRVALHLAEAGTEVVAIERDEELVEELRTAAAGRDLALTAVADDACELETIWPLDRPPAAAIAPLHLIQQIDPARRPGLLAALAVLCRRGAPVALTVVDEDSMLAARIGGGTVPDMVERDGWVYASEPLWVQVGDEDITVRRLRRRVAPEGEVERGVHDEHLHRLDPAALESEAEAAGLIVRERRAIDSPGPDADSIAVVLEAP